MKTPQFAHQKIGTAALIKNPAFALFDEMGAGKSKQVIDAACTLAEQGKIDTVVVVAPASVRCVWLDREIGEIKKHSWAKNHVYELHQKTRLMWYDTITKDDPIKWLTWIVTNYEFLRGKKHLEELTVSLSSKALLVLDESSYIKNRTAAQTKAVLKLRQHCARCVLLNGTPVTNSPLDLWSQMQVLSPDILENRFKNFYHFRSEFCEMQTMRFGMRSFPQVKAYRRLDKLAKIVAPYVLRRLKADCLDLPEKLYTEREVALTPESWKRYCELKKDALISLGESGEKRMEPNAAVRLMRLAQLTSGILGGTLESVQIDETDTRASLTMDRIRAAAAVPTAAQDLSDEKLRWAVQYLTEECTAKAVIVWTRWRRERERLITELRESKFDGCVQELYGGQKATARTLAVQVFSDTSKLDGGKRKILIAQPHAGGHGLNLVAASEAIYLSNDFALGIRLQSEDRMHRPGQNNPCLYIDVLATGPSGQKTIDHVIFKALHDKKSVADLTTAEWRKELENE